jgi:alkylation response protein AidB-like acyl-CoA dehydrogenase
VTSARPAEQEQFAAALHDMLSAADVAGAARRWAAGDHAPGLGLWRRLAGLGVTALAVPEKCGGLGASPLDVVVACEELGHHALPGPVAESVAAVPALLTALMDENLRAEGPIADGPLAEGPSADRPLADRPLADRPLADRPLADRPLADRPLADRPLADRPFADRPLADRPLADGPFADGPFADGPGGAELCGGWLTGLAAGDLIAALALPPRLPYAVDADAADLVLLVSADAVAVASPGARHQSVDPARSLFEVSGQQVLARGPAVADAAARALRLGALASAAQLLGAGRALLEASVQYAGQRVQFGRPVGAFQAVKHHLADVAIGLEFARPLLDAAAIALAAGSAAGGAGTAARDVSAAKVACADAAHRAARAALQVHGAIGYTQEHDLGLLLTKVRALVPAWGSQAEHRAAVMAALTGDGEAPCN